MPQTAGSPVASRKRPHGQGQSVALVESHGSFGVGGMLDDLAEFRVTFDTFVPYISSASRISPTKRWPLTPEKSLPHKAQPFFLFQSFQFPADDGQSFARQTPHGIQQLFEIRQLVDGKSAGIEALRQIFLLETLPSFLSCLQYL
jgi:hypothetical protein